MWKPVGIFSVLVMTASVSNAGTLLFYKSMFGGGSNSLGTGTVPLTNSQLTAAAAGVTLANTNGASISTLVTLPQFNDGGGTLVLDSVQIALGWAIEGAVVATNTNTAVENVTGVTSTVPITLTPPAFVEPFVVDAVEGPFAGSVPKSHATGENQTNCEKNGGVWDGAQCMKSGNATFGSTTSPSYGAAHSAVLTSGLQNYVGNGNVDIDLVLDPGQYSGTVFPGVTFAVGSSSTGGVMEIIYNYHAAELQSAPEPASVFLMGIAGAALALRVKRSRK